MKKAVIVLSGGLDSSTALYIAKSQGYELYAITFFYGQKHKIELECAKIVAKEAGVIEHNIINLPVIKGSALTEDIQMPCDRNLEDISKEIPVSYVAARNTLFIAFALSYAEQIDADAIFTGVTAIDASGYPDTRPQYIKEWQKLINLATKKTVGGGEIELMTPLLNLYKAEIIEIGTELGLDYGTTHSCFIPGMLIHTLEGMIPIENVKEGDRVYTHKGRLRRVISTMEREIDEQILCTHFYGTPKIYSTTEHPFYTSNNNFISAAELPFKEFISPIIKLQYDQKNYAGEFNLTEEFALFLGVFAAEGSFGKDPSHSALIDLSLNSDEINTEIIKKVMKYLSQEVEGSSTIKVRENVIYKNGSNVSVVNKDLYFKLLNLLKGRLTQDRLYEFVLGWDKKFQIEFLKGYIFGDGFYNVKENRIGISSINFNLINVSFNILFQHGIPSALTVASAKNCNGNFPQLRVFFSASHMKEFSKEVLSVIVRDNINNCFISDAGVRKLFSKTFLQYTGPVYNLEVEEDNSYIVNSVPVHNCYNGERPPCMVCDTCVEKGSLVLMANYTLKAIQNIKKGEEIISFDEKTFKYSIAKVLNTANRGIRKVYELSSKDMANRLNITEDHIISYSSQGILKLHWEKFNKINRKDAKYYTYIYDYAYTISDLSDYNKGYLRGIFDGDGSATGRGVKLFQKDKKVIEEFILLYNNEIRLTKGNVYKKEKDIHYCQIGYLPTFLSKTAYKNDINYMMGYVAGMLIADGCVYRNKKQASIRAIFTQKSNKVEYINFFETCLRELDIDYYKNIVNLKSAGLFNKEGIEMCNISFGGIWRIPFLYGGDKKDRIIKIMSDYYKQQLFVKIKINKFNRDKIKIAEVFDIETTSGSFIANGFVVHNCILRQKGFIEVGLRDPLIEEDMWEEILEKYKEERIK